MVASQSQPNAVSGSLVGTPTSATKTTKATAQISIPMIRRLRRSAVTGSAGVSGGVSRVVTGTKVNRARSARPSRERRLVERAHHGQGHPLVEQLGRDLVDVVGRDRVDPG